VQRDRDSEIERGGKWDPELEREMPEEKGRMN
jgi:hypothetical protein